MHVGNAGRRPLLAMRPSTSSATSRRRAPSFTRGTASSRASRETAPARRRDSRAVVSMDLRSLGEDALTEDLRPRACEIDDGGFPAERSHPSIDVKIDAIPELLPRFLACDGGSMTVDVRGGRGNRAVGFGQEPRERMGGDSKRDPAFL